MLCLKWNISFCPEFHLSWNVASNLAVRHFHWSKQRTSNTTGQKETPQRGYVGHAILTDVSTPRRLLEMSHSKMPFWKGHFFNHTICWKNFAALQLLALYLPQLSSLPAHTSSVSAHPVVENSFSISLLDLGWRPKSSHTIGVIYLCTIVSLYLLGLSSWTPHRYQKLH